jgi:ABC-type cobalamin/Fe3+-siderophores transport system ATPase subunit
MWIQQISIKNLWKKGNIKWDLKTDVNVLVGNNGSGKSTLLNLVYEALQPEISEAAKKKYFSLIGELAIRFTDDTFIVVDSSGERFPINIDTLKLNIARINTFDISNSLDDLIGASQLQFEIYQKNKYKSLNSILEQNTIPTNETMTALFGPRKSFIDKLNYLFSPSSKKFSEDSFSFKLIGQEYELSYKQLSSGEKQIFYILLQALLQDNKPSVLLLDEPEISLHIEWQRGLIESIRELNPHCQVVAVTHSSNMFFRSWLDHKLNIEDIRQTTSNSIVEKISIKSRLMTFKDEFQRIIDKSTAPNFKKLNDVNSMLHRTFFILTLQDCKSFLKTMRDAGLQPDHFAYTTLISKVPDLASAKVLLKDMKSKKIIPNGVTYVNIMKKSESFGDAMEVFDLMRTDKIEPAIQHFSVLLGKADHSEMVRKVEELRSLYGVPTNDIYVNKLHIKK